MQKAREYLKELINRGQEMLKPKYNPNTITNAWQLANTGPSQEEIRNWERDVKSYAYRYLKNHYAYTIINNAFNYQGARMINSVINYLENVYNDWEFWDKSGTMNHAWSGGPLITMAKYIAGIRPAAVAYRETEIKPQLGPLNYINCRVPSARGEISVNECR